MKDISDEPPPLGGHGGHCGAGGHGHGGLEGGAGGGQLHRRVLSLLTRAELTEAGGLQALHSVHLCLCLAGAEFRPRRAFIC